MRVEKCINGHFFDVDTYDACPTCGATVDTKINIVKQNDGKQKRDSRFSTMKKKLINNIDNIVKQHLEEKVVTEESFESDNSDSAISDNVFVDDKIDTNVNKKAENTFAFWEDNKEIIDKNFDKSQDTYEETDNKEEHDIISEENVPVEPLKKSSKTEQEIIDEIKKVSANNEGKTVSYFSAVNKENEEKKATVTSSQVDPVVGWLVCIQGGNFGESFCIYSGNNSIGRNNSNRIVVDKDMSISREKHSSLVYEPKKRNFFIQPGSGRGITYLNEEDVFETKKLTANDIIEIGNSKLMFIPLCSEKFSWEDRIKE